MTYIDGCGLVNQEETVVTEARLERVASGLAPVTPGWFVVNTAEAAWVNNEWSGGVCIFESDDFVLRGRRDLATGATISSGCTADPRPRSGTRRDRRSTRPIPSAEGDGTLSAQSTGTSFRWAERPKPPPGALRRSDGLPQRP